MGIVGESGSGKTVAALSILRLLPTAIVEGESVFDGVSLLEASDESDAPDVSDEIAKSTGRPVPQIKKGNRLMPPEEYLELATDYKRWFEKAAGEFRQSFEVDADTAVTVRLRQRGDVLRGQVDSFVAECVIEFE